MADFRILSTFLQQKEKCWFIFEHGKEHRSTRPLENPFEKKGLYINTWLFFGVFLVGWVFFLNQIDFSMDNKFLSP